MPKIERSVDYTFEAYSGLEDGEQDSKCIEKLPEMNFRNSQLDDGSDIDDTSKYLLQNYSLYFMLKHPKKYKS